LNDPLLVHSAVGWPHLRIVPDWFAPPSKARPDCTLVMLAPLPEG
jgi:hypothetical protein